MNGSASLLARLSPKKQELLLRHLAAKRTDADDGEIRPLPGGSGRFPLSFAQQRLWFLDRLQPGSAAYNVFEGLRLLGPLDRGALARSLAEIARRHAVLRVTFDLDDTGPVQVVAPDTASPTPVLPMADLSHLGAEERELELQRLAAAESGRPFDLARGPLRRFLLLRLAPGEHTLVVTLHHIVSDAGSMEIFFGELGALYAAFAADRPSPLAALPVQYTDFAAWQRRRLEGERLAGQLAWWRQRLAGSPAVLPLPTDRPQPAVQTAGAIQRLVALSPSAIAPLRALAQGAGATMFMALLAVFAALLQRYTAEEDLLMGTPMAHRERPEVERLIGLFVNTLVLRIDLAGAPTFRTLVSRVRDAVLGAFANADVPFEKIVEEVQPERLLGKTPLFRVLFSLLRDTPPAAPPRLASGLRPDRLSIPSRSAKLDLQLSLTDAESWVRGFLELDADLFERVTAARWGAHFERLAESAAFHPEVPVTALPLLSGTELHQVLREWNDTARAHPSLQILQRLIEAQVDRAPDAVAVTADEGSLTYRELDRRASRLARHLGRLGVGPEVRVGIALERSSALLAALLATLKSGGAYVPLDPSHPRERLAMILDDARPAVLLTGARLRDELPVPAGCLVVCLDGAWDDGGLLPLESGDDLDTIVETPESLAYVIFTSGSTGRPKGVQITQGALVNFLLSMQREPGLGARDVLVAVTTVSFDIAALELFLPLLVGARIELAGREEVFDGALLSARIASTQATTLQATPSGWRILLDAGWPGDPRLKALCGGEALTPDLAERLLPKVGSLWNVYGPTETTIFSAAGRVESVSPAMASTGSVPIGPAIANTTLYVLDPCFEPAPIGVAGDLFIGGAGLSRGYLGSPAMTADRFVPDPFAGRSAPGERLYRTGDRARLAPDRAVEYLGRVDDQVKIRGVRIELGEVEAAIRSHSGVREAAVVALPNAAGGLRLVAYCVPAVEAPPASAELRVFLKAQLPDAMVPAVFIALPALPRTPSGKVDRRALPAPDPATAPSAAAVPPRDLLELQLARLWEEILGAAEVGIGDDFFALGGHSLLAVRLMSRIEKQLGLSLPVSTLFAAPSLEGLARTVRRCRPGGPISPLVEIQAGDPARPALFLVHPLGGNVLCYLRLARQLGRDQPVYGLQDPNVLQAGEPRFDLGEMVDLYAEALRSARPRGPYRLGGWSFGGVLAQELARRLEADGEEVELLLLIDSQSPAMGVLGDRRDDEGDDGGILAWFAGQLRVPLPAADLPLEGRVHAVLTAAQEAGRLPADLEAAQAQRIFAVYRTEMSALRGHSLRPCACRIVLLRAEQGVRGERERGQEIGLGWHGVSPETEIVVVPGSHQTLMDEPYVHALAREIRVRLDEIAGMGGDR